MSGANPDRGTLEYAENVVDGFVPACELTRLACERSLRERASPPDGYVYDADYALALIDFAESLVHVTGDFAKPLRYVDGEPVYRGIRLEPWQRWFFGELYGWRRADDLNVRRFTEATLEISKKNGKTLMGAIVALYELVYGGEGQEVFSAAGKQDQARIVWNMTAKLADRASADVVAGVTQVVSEIRSPSGTFRPLSKEAKNLDGPNPSVLLVDEAAVIESRDVVEKLLTAMGARLAPLVLYLTTAQTRKDTIYWEKREALRLILEGAIAGGERTFGCIWSLDDDDEIWVESAWEKANPNLGVSVQTDTLRGMVADCKVTPAKTSSVLRLNFNRWVGSTTGYVDLDDWRASKGKVQRGGRCWIGVDLAETNDLAAVARLWGTTANRCYADFHCWTTERFASALPDHLQGLFREAADRGVLTVCEGKSIDMDSVEDYVRESHDTFDVVQTGFDRYGAKQMVNRLDRDGLPVILVSQAASFLNEPTRRLAALIGKKDVVHEGDPFIAWQLENCTLNTAHDLWKVRKSETEPLKKVDAISALVNAVSVWEPDAEPESEPDVSVTVWE